jgi:subtilisin family serine protease
MRFFIQIALLTVICLQANAQKLYRLPAKVTSADYLAKTIILRVKPAFRAVCANEKIGHGLFNNLAASIGMSHLHKKFPLDKAPEKEFNEAGQRYADLSLIYELNYTADLHIEKAISKLLASGILLYAEPHFVPKTTYSPNDPLATPSGQYHLQTINAFNAWDVNRGDSAIVIGITDTGTDPTHNDLFNNIKRNYNDPVDGIDNDLDGYVDNYMGWDVGVDDNDPTWQANAHGIHVCGLAAASADNTIGGAGVGFNCKFLPVKIADASGALIAAYEGIKYAADHGCDVINCSWGGSGASVYGQNIIDYATINKNCLVVCAAGNDGLDEDFYPAAFNYVLSVANTTQTDTKFFNSNYGYFIDVCAPGDNVSSTWPGNLYVSSSGTSMSSPVVSGAAAIVKKQFPSYNGLQVGQRLKVTCDDIYPANPSYLNKLGAGRINLFRALTDPAIPGVVFTDEIISDHNDEAFLNGDTLFITGKFINYLDPTVALNVTVTPLSSYAVTIDNTTSLGIINTLASKNNNADPFTFKLTGAIPINQLIEFEVLMQDGAYTAKQYISVYINVDYINITVNDVYTTATSKGKIGYNQDAQVQGLGFSYKGTDLLYEAGLMIGKDTTHVSDCVRGSNPTPDADFGSINRIVKQVPSVNSDFDTQAKLSDNLSVGPLPIEVDQNTYAWSSVPNTQFVIWEYVLRNTHATDTIKNVYAGIFADWDIDGGTYAENRSAFDAATKMGYCYYTAPGGNYAGIKLLTNTAPPNFYAVDNVAGGNGGFDLTNGFDVGEKYKTLSTPRLAAGVGGTGSDNINIMSSGPFTLGPNQTVKVAFAIIGGDSLPNLVSAANQAQIKYDSILPTSVTEIKKDNGFSIFPNPGTGAIIISQTDKLYTKYEIYDLSGKMILQNNIQSTRQAIDMTSYAKGMYIIKVAGAEKMMCRKIILTD